MSTNEAILESTCSPVWERLVEELPKKAQSVVCARNKYDIKDLDLDYLARALLKERQIEKEEAHEVAQLLCISVERLFPKENYPWLYCDKNNNGRVSNIRLHSYSEIVMDTSSESDEESIGLPQTRADKMRITRAWQRAYRALVGCEDPSPMQLQYYQIRTRELVRSMITQQEIPFEYREGLSEELEAYVLILASNHKEDHAHSVGTYTNNILRDIVQLLCEKLERAPMSIESEDSNEFDQDPTSLHEICIEEYDSTDDTGLRNLLMDKDTDTAIDNAESQLLIERTKKVLKTLSYKQREIIKLRFGLGDGFDYTRTEIGEIFRVTKDRIGQIEKKAIGKLQQPARAQELVGFM